jgi:hypothetical protein
MSSQHPIPGSHGLEEVLCDFREVWFHDAYFSGDFGLRYVGVGREARNIPNELFWNNPSGYLLFCRQVYVLAPFANGAHSGTRGNGEVAAQRAVRRKIRWSAARRRGNGKMQDAGVRMQGAFRAHDEQVPELAEIVTARLELSGPRWAGGSDCRLSIPIQTLRELEWSAEAGDDIIVTLGVRKTMGMMDVFEKEVFETGAPC